MQRQRALLYASETHFAVRGALHFSQLIDEETSGGSIETYLRNSAVYETRLMMIFGGKQTARGSLFLSSKSITVSLYISRQEARTLERVSVRGLGFTVYGGRGLRGKRCE